MNPYLCTPEECYDRFNECYMAISYCRKLRSSRNLVFPNEVSDLDEVEIYSNYGEGFYWRGTGSESIKMIKDNLDPYEDCYENIQYGMPQWASDFLSTISYRN